MLRPAEQLMKVITKIVKLPSFQSHVLLSKVKLHLQYHIRILFSDGVSHIIIPPRCLRKKNAKENYQTNYPPEIFIQKEKAYTISSFDFLLGHFLQVGCEKSFVLLLFLFGQISEALDFSPALYVPAETVGEVLDFIVSHGIVIGQFFSCFNVPVGFVDPVGPIKPDTAVGIAGMIDASAYLSEHDPLFHSNLTGMRIVGAIIFLYLTGIDYISSFQVFSSVKSLTLLA